MSATSGEEVQEGIREDYRGLPRSQTEFGNAYTNSINK